MGGLAGVFVGLRQLTRSIWRLGEESGEVAGSTGDPGRSWVGAGRIRESF